MTKLLSDWTDFCFSDVEVQWCSQGDLLAVAGMERHGLPADSACASLMRNALVKFYNVQGEHIYTLETPAQVSCDQSSDQSSLSEHIIHTRFFKSVLKRSPRLYLFDQIYSKTVIL